MPAFRKGMSDGKAEIDEITKSKRKPTFENTVLAFDNTGELLLKVSEVFFAQAAANTSDSLQKIEMEMSPLLAGYRDEILLNPDLFKRVKSVYDNQAKFKLNSEQQFLLENLYKGFVRNGANLNRQDQEVLKVLNQRLSVLTVQFSQNVLAETNNYIMFVNKADLKGLPEAVVSTAAETAKAAGQEGRWAFTTQRPSIFPFLQYCENRNLRKQFFYAYTNRSNNDNEFDNNLILAEIIKLRAERAKLLGYNSHSHIVLEPRMANVPENVFNLLDNLWEKSIPVAKDEATDWV